MPHRTMEETENQSAALEFLARAENYDPRPAEEPEHIVTHGSHVFLAGDRAYKLKRAVSFQKKHIIFVWERKFIPPK